MKPKSFNRLAISAACATLCTAALADSYTTGFVGRINRINATEK